MHGLVVLISGRGSNLQAILKSPVGQQVAAVISDNAAAGGLQIARDAGVPTHVCEAGAGHAGRAGFEQALTEQIKPYAPTLIALAGFMRVLSPAFIAAHGGRIVNIHPSLLPAFPGLHTHRRALAEGAKTHGCSVHWVNDVVDGGQVIACKQLQVNAYDNADTLAERVLKLEHALYPQVLQTLLATPVETDNLWLKKNPSYPK